MWMNNITLPITYVPIPDTPKLYKRKSLMTLAFSIASAATLLLVFFLLVSSGQSRAQQSLSDHVPVHNRGVSEGVSVKSTGVSSSSDTSYPWTNNMLSWQRTGFHFQPQKNWMNDPDAPLFYKGWYHLFYQYNPDSAVWGNITWGHAVSRDMINWRYLPLSLVPDHWYDSNGVWTGSATILPNDHVIILYTGSTNTLTQVQNLAVPADPTDPLLVDWIKSDANPVLVPPRGIGQKDFRDPTSAWYVESTSSWRVAIGSKTPDHAGIVLVYETKDFLNYNLLPGVLHEVPGTGMWECVDFYPLRTEDGMKHVLKASFDDDKHDYYGVGVYDLDRELWVPDDPGMDVGTGLRLDYGKYYASKSFYDDGKRRRVVWGWTGETDSERTDLMKGWASLQTIPRTVSYDNKTKSNLIQWPVEEVESLRLSLQEHTNITLRHGSILPIDLKYADQLDITAEFQIDSSTSLETTINEADVVYNCSTSNGSRERGLLGPFGLLVLADEDLIEQTAVYFYIARGVDGSFQTFFCQDELRSSKANDIVKRVYGTVVPVLNGESLSVRILVDHSIVESFAQGGRTCITSRVYPTRAIYGAARVFLFNNATNSNVLVRNLKIWQMNSATLRPYTEDEDHKSY